MILQRAITEYLERDLRDLSYFKGVSEAKLDRLLAEKADPSTLTTKPYVHQKACLVVGTRWKRALFLLDMGLGKTKLSFDLVTLAKSKGDNRRTLVLVPSITNVGGWVDDAQVHAPNLHVQGLSGSKTARLEILDTEADVTVMTYAAFTRYCTTGVKVKKRKNKKLKPDKKKIRGMLERFGNLICDESDSFANSQSTLFRCLRQVTKGMNRVYALTGTPFGHDPLDLWAQYYIVDQGETFGETLGMFREAFFSAKELFFGGFKYTLKKRFRRKLNRWMMNRAIRYEEGECLDLPKKVYSVVKVTLPASTWTHYERLKEAMKSARKNAELRRNTYVEARYLTAGFMALKGDDGTVVEVRMGANPKLEALLEILAKVPKGRKVIIFNEYKRTGAMLEDELKKAGRKCLRLFSGTPDKESLARRFTNNPKVDTLICSKAGTYGLNLQVANYVIFYESPTEPKARKQMEKRAHRIGQTRTVFYYDLVVNASVDVKILKYLAQGKNLVDAVVDGKETI